MDQTAPDLYSTNQNPVTITINVILEEKCVNKKRDKQLKLSSPWFERILSFKKKNQNN